MLEKCTDGCSPEGLQWMYFGPRWQNIRPQIIVIQCWSTETYQCECTDPTTDCECYYTVPVDREAEGHIFLNLSTRQYSIRVEEPRPGDPDSHTDHIERTVSLTAAATAANASPWTLLSSSDVVGPDGESVGGKGKTEELESDEVGIWL